ncbi:hypothetical protein K9U40_03850 [Xanthobacter autotrophicus]|uniref:hypothetical protein n=1 Tax=Xanthobacter TaxID=279 RepID=UPI0024ABDDA6|nr:hypothetical protein [Xanthobacter autotrophicus]MDI4663472.1 hypothetical protein [Xanthobacter autotrophicus]
MVISIVLENRILGELATLVDGDRRIQVEGIRQLVGFSMRLPMRTSAVSCPNLSKYMRADGAAEPAGGACEKQSLKHANPKSAQLLANSSYMLNEYGEGCNTVDGRVVFRTMLT